MPATLLDAKNTQIPTLANLCADDPRVVAYINDAQQRLLSRGKWWGTFKRALFCLQDGCIVWPREVASIEAFQICGRNTELKNAWFEFREDVAPPTSNKFCIRDRLLDRGNVPCFAQPTVAAHLALYVTNAADVGKQVLVQGLDQNGIVIRNTYGGNTVDGEYVTLVASPGFVTTIAQFSQVTGVQKPQTVDRVLMFWIDPTTATQTAMATYAWNELNPTYRRSYLTRFPSTDSCQPILDDCPTAGSCTTGQTVATIVKLAFIPATVDTDWLLIGNLPALTDMVNAILKKERRDYDEAAVLEASALRELRNELRTMTGDRTTVWVDTQGNAQLWKHFGGFI